MSNTRSCFTQMGLLWIFLLFDHFPDSNILKIKDERLFYRKAEAGYMHLNGIILLCQTLKTAD